MATYRSERDIPEQEKQQPDPMLQMSTGGMGGSTITIAAVVAAVLLGVVFYGLNAGFKSEQASSGATQSGHPQAGQSRTSAVQ
jgi:hypothetical protein